VTWKPTPLQAELLERFRPVLSRVSGSIQLTEELTEAFTIEADGALRVIWAPFGYMRDDDRAQAVLVGITPGRYQAERALSAFRDAFGEGLALDDAIDRVKATASFGGPLRTNLVAMLDHIGLQGALGLRSCADLFQSSGQLVHFTSALHYPVLVNGANYSGTPDVLHVKMLRDWLDGTSAEDARCLSRPLWIPLGPKPAKALRYLAERGLIDPIKILDGLPHPSGANAERIAYFLGHKERALLSAKTSAQAIDAARDKLREQVRMLKASVV
jgi:hypothetical protein